MKLHLPGALLSASLILCGAGVALADGGLSLPASVPPVYLQECGACHVAYPPGLLPSPSWQRIMSGLDRHYGTDASLQESTTQSLSAWLQAHAGTYRHAAQQPPQDRITRLVWFERKHRKLDASVWKLPSVRSAANCAACHTRADQGRFDDKQLQVPEGLTPRQRGAWVN